MHLARLSRSLISFFVMAFEIFTVARYTIAKMAMVIIGFLMTWWVRVKAVRVIVIQRVGFTTLFIDGCICSLVFTNITAAIVPISVASARAMAAPVMLR